MGSFWRKLDGSAAAEDRAKDLYNKQNEARAAARDRQYQYLNMLQSPTLTPQMERRLKALEDESQPGSLISDPYFQADRANLVQGGAKALASVDQAQKANQVQGGFANTGSQQDVYDRMGTQLAALGQKSRETKDAKAEVAAKARQDYADAVQNFENARIQARAAIDAGDAAAAAQLLNQAYAAQEQAKQASRSFWTSMAMTGAGAGVGALAGGTLAGASIGNMMGGGGAGVGNAISALSGLAGKFGGGENTGSFGSGGAGATAGAGLPFYEKQSLVDYGDPLSNVKSTPWALNKYNYK